MVTPQVSPPILQFIWMAILVATLMSPCFLDSVLVTTTWLGTRLEQDFLTMSQFWVRFQSHYSVLSKKKNKIDKALKRGTGQ